MNSLNATIIVQGIHFLCAYLLLDRFFFRPAIKSISDQEIDEAQKQKRNEEEEVIKNELLSKKARQWEQFKKECGRLTPAVSHHVSIGQPVFKKKRIVFDAARATQLRKECATVIRGLCSTVRK